VVARAEHGKADQIEPTDRATTRVAPTTWSKSSRPDFVQVSPGRWLGKGWRSPVIWWEAVIAQARPSP